MTFHALPQLPLTHDRTSDDLSRAPDHSFVRAKFKRGRDRCSRAYRRLACVRPCTHRDAFVFRGFCRFARPVAGQADRHGW
jgi:hypothetical protein